MNNTINNHIPQRFTPSPINTTTEHPPKPTLSETHPGREAEYAANPRPIQGDRFSPPEATADQRRLNLHARGQQTPSNPTQLDTDTQSKPRSVAELTRENDQLRSEMNNLRNEVKQLTALITELKGMIGLLRQGIDAKKMPENNGNTSTQAARNTPAPPSNDQMPGKPASERSIENNVPVPTDQTAEKLPGNKLMQELKKQNEALTEFIEQLAKGLEEASKNIMAQLQRIIKQDPNTLPEQQPTTKKPPIT